MIITRREFITSTCLTGASVLLAGCPCPERVTEPMPPGGNAFAVMAGSRLSPGGTRGALTGARKLAVFRRALLAEARERVGACFMLGNMIENTSLGRSDFELLEKTSSDFFMPVYVLPGDREAVPPIPGAPFTKEEFIRAAQKAGFAPPKLPCEIALAGSITAFLMDTTHPGERNGRLTPNDLAWLKKKAAKYPDNILIVLLHHPPLVPDELAVPGRPFLRGAELAKAAFSSMPNLAAVFSAHTGVPFVMEHSGVQYIGTGDLAVYPHTYVHAGNMDGRLEVSFRCAADKETLARSKRLYAGTPAALALAEKIMLTWKIARGNK